MTVEKEYVVINGDMFLLLNGEFIDLDEETRETREVWKEYDARGNPFLYYHNPSKIK